MTMTILGLLILAWATWTHVDRATRGDRDGAEQALEQSLQHGFVSGNRIRDELSKSGLKNLDKLLAELKARLDRGGR